MGKQQQQQQLCMVLLTAFLVVSTMDVVPVAAGRALGQVSYGGGALIPGSTPSVPRGQPYTRPCPRIYACNPPAAAAGAGAGGAP